MEVQDSRKSLMVILFICVLIGGMILGVVSLPAVPGHAARESVALTSAGPGPKLVIYQGDSVVHRFSPPPERFLQRKPATANITVTYIGPWDLQAKNAFGYAVDIWESVITSTVEIKVNANWSNLGAGILGSAYAADSLANFTNAPQADTFYPIALANKLAGSDLAPGQVDIEASFNSAFTGWYFGTDGNPGSDTDFVSVVLHELGHGLGFFGSMMVDETNSGLVCGAKGNGCWGFGGPYPYVYDLFTENGSGQSLLNDFPNNSTELADQLTSNNIFFNGTHTNAANGGAPAELYAPSTWQTGSSYSHLADSFNGTSNALMTWSISPGEAQHHPGSVTLGMFEDMGWTVSYSATPPSPSPVTNPVYLPVLMNNYFSVAQPGFWSGTYEEFYVTEDGAFVQNFATYIDVPDCGLSGYKITHEALEPITDGQFSFTGAFYANGTFDTNKSASGTDGLDEFPIEGCGLVSGGPFTWSTSWKDSSQPALRAELVVPIEALDSLPPLPRGFVVQPRE